MNNKYPTKKEILENEPLIEKKVITVVSEWKKNVWNKKNKTKQSMIERLINLLNKYYKQNTTIEFKPTIDRYEAIKNKITLTKPSIITCLHEYAHSLKMNEKEACYYSVWIFKKVFPRAYKKLKWKNHMLIK